MLRMQETGCQDSTPLQGSSNHKQYQRRNVSDTLGLRARPGIVPRLAHPVGMQNLDRRFWHVLLNYWWSGIFDTQQRVHAAMDKGSGSIDRVQTKSLRASESRLSAT